MTFSNEEKVTIFDKIAELYFNRNFGSMSKSDFETFMFSEYIEHCLRNDIPFDDYSLSKELGITQSRIRSLKERKELKYPYKDFDWKSVFADSVENAKYDEKDHYVKFIIQDVNVMNEVRHYIEEKGWYDECSLNKKLLRIPLDCFIEICVDDDSINNLFNEDAKKAVEKIEKSDNRIAGFLKDFSIDGLKAFAMSAGKEALLAVLQCLPFGGPASIAIRFLSQAIENTSL